jgi:diguanylate cyclase (GGDEF)-like protein
VPPLLRSFQTRIERRLALLFFGFCVVPLVVLTSLTASIIESQTLEVARRHLAEQSKGYAMHLIDRFEVAAWEVGLGPVPVDSGQSPDDTAVRGWRWAESVSSSARADGRNRSVLRARDGGFAITVPAGDRLYTGFLGHEVLFADLDHAPFGVRRCVRVGKQPRRCAGPASSAPAIRAAWSLSLASLYDTDAVIEITSSQPEEIALRHIGVLYQILPYLVFALMAIGGWWVLSQLRARFAPVAELRRATEQIQQGDYSGTVVIRSGDELERLGDAFNAMTRRLHKSFNTMRTLSEMDHMVLNGAHLEDLVRQALMLMQELGSPADASAALVWLWDADAGTSEIYLLNADRRLERSTLAVPGLDAETVDAALAVLRSHCLQDIPQDICLSAPITRDGTLSGLIACTAANCDRGHAETLAELGDRISVAVTLLSRGSALFRQAHFDGLTGLLNREAFSERLDRACRSGAREELRGALICLDLDRFKQVNDTEGHHIGDRLLKIIGERLRHSIRATDEVARLGGDEFAVLMPRVEETSEIEMLCRRVMADINRPVEIDGITHVTEVSLGVAVFPDDGEDAPTLLRKADVAMYKAKQQSGCAFAFYDGEMNRETRQRAQVENRLRGGLEARELCLYFQPKVRVSDGKVVGVEGLLRWPSEKSMNPGVFIPVAEQTGLIHQMTPVLIDDAQQCLDRCREAGFDIERVAINISPRQFQRSGFAEGFLELLHARGASPRDFEIEVTESIFVEDPQAVARDLTMLRSAGISIALDDFGTGYSSLNVLRELPLDVIKIDRSFVAPISESPQARDLIGRIIDIVHSLQLTSVAEGVETEREMQIMKAKRCDVVQGFLFSPGLPIPALLQFLKDHSRTALSA